MTSSFFSKRLFAAVAVLSALSAFDAAKADIFTSCGIDLGAAGRTKQWAVFTIGGTMKMDNLSGSSYVVGDVGVSGNGDIELSGTVTLYGDLYYHTGGTLHTSGHAFITGSTHQDVASDNLLDQAAIDAQNASNAAFALPVTPGSPTKIDTDKNMTITLSGACTVFKLSDFKLKGGAVLSLVGTTAQAIIINVTNEFKLSGGSRIILSGGLTWDSVLINITGNKDAELSGGSKMSGIVMATHRKVKLSGASVVFGEVIANNVEITGGSSVQQPNFTPVQNP